MSLKDVDFQRGPFRRLFSNFIGGKMICAVSREAEMYFWRVYAVVDDFGNVLCEPVLLHAITKGRRPMEVGEVVDWVNELSGVGLLGLYENAAGDDFVHIMRFVEWQPAGPNGKRVRRFPPSPWDESEGENDYMYLGRQKVLRLQGESKIIRRDLPSSNAMNDRTSHFDDASPAAKRAFNSNRVNSDRTDDLTEENGLFPVQPNFPQSASAKANGVNDIGQSQKRDGRGNPTHNYNYSYNKNITLDDSLFRVVKSLDKTVFVVEVYEHWKRVMQLNESALLSSERQKKIEARWKDSTLEEVFAAIDGCEGSDFYMARGKYENESPHYDIKMICKDRSKIEELMAKPRRRAQRTEAQTHTEEGAKSRWQSK